MIRGGEGNDGVITVGAPPCLVDIPLANMGGVTSGWTSTLHVGNNARDFSHTGVADGLLFEGKSWATGGRHNLLAS